FHPGRRERIPHLYGDAAVPLSISCSSENRALGGRVEAAALPVTGKAVVDGDGTSRTRRSPAIVERSQESAVAALAAVSSYLDSDEDVPAFFGRLCTTVAELTRARRAAFWRLGPRGTLALQPAPFGFIDDSALYRTRLQMGAGGEGVIERVVFSEEVELVKGTSPALDQLWRASGLRGVKTSIAAAWRAGDRRIGAVAVYDSSHGFTPHDLWVLRLVGMVAGVVWQYKESEDDLARTATRLEQAMLARRQLLNNIAAGGDDAR